MFKFRTMVADAEEAAGDARPLDRTREPMFKLRKTRARDTRRPRPAPLEPRRAAAALNVLRGEHEPVGPRPEQLELVERYRPSARLFGSTVKPGLTGPMQVYGRGS